VSRRERVERDGFVARLRSDRASERLLERALELATSAARDSRILAELFEAAGESAWIKGDHLPGKARWRHTLAGVLGRASPREREFERLKWLRARLFRAPKPLAAGSLRAGGVLRYQFLVLAPLPAHETLAHAWSNASSAERAELVDELSREIARLHALHFVHRNLFFRNLLVDRSPRKLEGDPRRLVFIDPWRGGEALPRRGVSYDLGALMVDAAEHWDFDAQRRFFAGYFEQRALQGLPAHAATLLPSVAMHHRALARRAKRSAVWDWRRLASALPRTESDRDDAN
jgi:hypothetical protein